MVTVNAPTLWPKPFYSSIQSGGGAFYALFKNQILQLPHLETPVNLRPKTFLRNIIEEIFLNNIFEEIEEMIFLKK